MKSLRFLFLSTTDWDAPQFGSRQQIAQLLARRGHNVLFVDVARALHSFISAPGDTRRALGRMGQIRSIADRLHAYTPFPVLPIYYHPATNWMSQRLLRRDLHRAMRRLGWADLDVFWTYWPNSAFLATSLSNRLAVYHCIDALTAVAYPLTPADAITRQEASLCRAVDIIFARTEELAADKRQYNATTIFLPGGVDLELFDPQAVDPPPPEISAISSPRIGFVGTFDDRLDTDLLVACAAALPAASFIFVGPVKHHLAQIRELARMPHVHFFPPCAHTAVPSIIRTLDVCLIPYRVTPYTQGLSPLKLYEYLAMGQPVVATDLPYLRREETHIAIADRPQDFINAVRQALTTPPTDAQRHRWRQAALAHSWSSQVDQIETLLHSSLSTMPRERDSVQQ